MMTMSTGAGSRNPAEVGAPRDAVGRALAGARAWVVTLLCLMIRIYQCLVSPLLGNCCRFEPSCSRYAQVCIERLGPVRGSWLALLRLLRCHPFCPGGHDPPPEVTS
jgi:putative membrane protein insertion efficiency factor